jgi:sugar transferase (PEP-CTERM/EpsH1 system associated)
VRVLFLTPRVPYPPDRGGEIIVFNFLKELAKRHEIALVSFYDNEHEFACREPLGRFCERIELVRRPAKLAPLALIRAVAGGWSYSIARHTAPGFHDAVRRVAAEWRPDVVQAETFVTGPYLADVPDVRSVLHMHDVTWVMWERMARVAPAHVRPLLAVEARRIRRDELASCRAADVCVPVSDVDLDRLRAADSRIRATVIVPGVDCDEFQPLAPVAPSSNLLFVGSMNYLPNVDAAEFFVRDVLPLVARDVPEVTFSIVGTRPSAAVMRLANNPRIRVTGRVPDVRPYYAAASATVVPLRAGGGVRMKILEAMAMGMPIVATTVGAEGLNLAPGRDLLIGDTPEQLARHAVRLLRDPAYGEQLGRHARATAVRRFSWASVVSQLEQVYASVVPGVKR